MKLDQAFPSNYLKCSDLNGREITATISEVKMEDVGDDHKPVVYFRGAQKGLVLNKTNGYSIGDIYGDDTDNWIGRKITLFPDKTSYQGKRVDCVRVKGPSDNGTQQSAPPSPPPPARTVSDEAGLDDEIPF